MDGVDFPVARQNDRTQDCTTNCSASNKRALQKSEKAQSIMLRAFLFSDACYFAPLALSTASVSG